MASEISTRLNPEFEEGTEEGTEAQRHKGTKFLLGVSEEGTEAQRHKGTKFLLGTFVILHSLFCIFILFAYLIL
jgi:hypothetical protein